VYQRLGISTVATVRWTVDQMVRRLLPPGAEPEWRDPSGMIRISVIAVPPSWVGHKLSDLETTGANVAFLTRLGQGRMPAEITALQDGDLLHLVIPENGADAVEAAILAGPEEL
jgi:trk system potassium uptake protein TrkA